MDIWEWLTEEAMKDAERDAEAEKALETLREIVRRTTEELEAGVMPEKFKEKSRPV